MPAALYSSPLKELMEKPEIVSTFNTLHSSRLYSLVCLGKDTVFIMAHNYIEEIKSLTESVKIPSVIEIYTPSYCPYTDNDRKILQYFTGFGSRHRHWVYIAEYDYIKKTAVLETKVGAIAIIPWDIAINSNGHPIYTERTTQTINLLKYGKTQVQLTLKDWRPLHVCSTLYGDLLVIMDSCD